MAVRRKCRICGAFLARDNFGDACSCHGVPEEAPPDATWLDGPRFVKWCEERGFTPRAQNDANASTTSKWRNGRRVHKRVAGEILDRHGLDLYHDLPGWVWSENQGYNIHLRKGAWPPEIRAKAMKAYLDGHTGLEVSREYGPSPDCIKKWCQGMPRKVAA